MTDYSLKPAFRLDGRKALVTGGSRGIGRAISLALGAAGADVVVNYRQDATAAGSVVAELMAMGRRSLAVPADTTDPAQVTGLVEGAAGFLGGLDILVANAGILKRAPVLDISPADWQAIINTNLTGTFLCAQAAARVMRDAGRGGAIVHTSSVSGLAPSRNCCHYSVSKAGVSMLTKCLALELAPHRIRVNEINPGLVETDLNRADIARPEFREARLSRIPLGRIGTPEDVAGAVVFLCSNEASLVTGHGIVVDGGAVIS